MSGRRSVDLSLGFAVLGGPLLWALHLVLGYGATEAACGPSATPAGELFAVRIRPLELGLTVVLALLAAASGIVAAFRLRRPFTDDARGERQRVAAATGAALGVLFACLIGFGGIASQVLEACG